MLVAGGEGEPMPVGLGGLDLEVDGFAAAFDLAEVFALELLGVAALAGGEGGDGAVDAGSEVGGAQGAPALLHR